jgi:hypothetical protein
MLENQIDRGHIKTIQTQMGKGTRPRLSPPGHWHGSISGCGQGFKAAYENDHQSRVPAEAFHQQDAWPTENEIAGRSTGRKNKGRNRAPRCSGNKQFTLFRPAAATFDLLNCL